MDGTVGLYDLRIDCIVGIYPHERIRQQTLRVDVALEVPFDRAAASDHVRDVLDYDHVAALLITLAEARGYQLIETFAAEGTAALLERFPEATAVSIEIRKPAAVPAAAAAFVRLRRTRT
jgi:dihydroneopterin aldolase